MRGFGESKFVYNFCDEINACIRCRNWGWAEGGEMFAPMWDSFDWLFSSFLSASYTSACDECVSMSTYAQRVHKREVGGVEK